MYQTTLPILHSQAPATQLSFPQTHSEAELVAAARQGDETAFRALFARYRRLVARLASRFFIQRERIEEIVPVTFTEVWCSLDGAEDRSARSFGRGRSFIVGCGVCGNISRLFGATGNGVDQKGLFQHQGAREQRVKRLEEKENTAFSPSLCPLAPLSLDVKRVSCPTEIPVVPTFSIRVFLHV